MASAESEGKRESGMQPQWGSGQLKTLARRLRGEAPLKMIAFV
jgi:hypothetical protein